MKNFENKQLVAIQKYDFVKQKQSQNVNDFIIYFEIFENDLNKFIVVQKKNYLLYCLKKTLKKNFK